MAVSAIAKAARPPIKKAVQSTATSSSATSRNFATAASAVMLMAMASKNEKCEAAGNLNKCAGDIEKLHGAGLG